jgi:hypothetical protein
MKKSIFAAITLVLGTIPTWAFAQNNQGCDPSLSPLAGAFANKHCNPNTLALNIVQFILGVAGMAAVLFIVIGGFQMILGGASADNVKKGKQTLTWAVIGLAIILLAYTIVAVVQFSVGNT